MTDIVEVIRGRIHSEFDGECHLTDTEAHEAADTIEALRAQLDEARKALERISAMEGTSGLEKGYPCRTTDAHGAREGHTMVSVFANDVANAALAAIRQRGESE